MNKIILFFLLLISVPVFADPVGLVVASRGTVYVNDRDLEQGNEVNQGDAIITADKSFVTIQFLDGSKMTVRPISQVVISEFEMSKTNSVEIGLISGGLRMVTGSIAKTDPDDYKITTPTALMGVRGTEFSIEYVE